MDTDTKRCSKCRIEKPVSAFGKDRTKADGLYSACGACRRVWRQANRPHIAQKNKDYREAHREELNAYTRQWREENREYIREFSKARRIANHDWYVAYDKARAQTPHRRQQKQHSRQKTRVRDAVRVAEWNRKHPDRIAMYHAKRKARKLGNGGTYTVAEWEALKAKHGHTCLRCGRKEPDIRLHADHVIPLVRGGANSIDNIQPLCMSCNSSKSAHSTDYRT